MTEGLFPPAGAGPGSRWWIVSPGGLIRWLARWTGAMWVDLVTEASWTPLELADRGYTLDAPHGLDAAHRVMSEAGVTTISLVQTRDGRWIAAIFRSRVGHTGGGSSALAAALDAVRAMREVEGRT